MSDQWREYRQELFNHLAQEYGITALEGEMSDIEAIVFKHPEFRARLSVMEANLKGLFGLDRRIRELEGLLLETRNFHLRYEERRDWLDRSNKALGLPPEA